MTDAVKVPKSTTALRRAFVAGVSELADTHYWHGTESKYLRDIGIRPAGQVVSLTFTLSGRTDEKEIRDALVQALEEFFESEYVDDSLVINRVTKQRLDTNDFDSLPIAEARKKICETASKAIDEHGYYDAITGLLADLGIDYIAYSNGE